MQDNTRDRARTGKRYLAMSLRDKLVVGRATRGRKQRKRIVIALRN